MKEPPKHANTWLSLILAVCSGIGMIWGAGRYYENKILKLKDFKDSQIEVKSVVDSILSMTQKNTAAIAKIADKVENQGKIQGKQIEAWKEFLQNNNDINKIMYSKLTDGLNNLTEEVKKKDF